MSDKIKITQIKGRIRTLVKQRKTLDALGLHGIRTSVIQTKSPALDGMLKVVTHLVKTEEV